MTINKIKLDNYNLYIFLIYTLWIISIISYFFLDDFVKAGNLEDGVKLGNDSYFYLRESKNILN